METVTPKKDPFRWVMLLFVCLFYFVILGFCNQSFNILLASINKDMGWGALERTAVATAMASGMMWFVFVAGSMLDAFKVKRIMASVLFIIAILIFLRSQAAGFYFWFTIMFLFGVASAFYMPACTKTISLWFDRDELAFANGWLTAASPVGQITANLFAVPIMMKIGGWQMLYNMVAVCVLIIVAFYFFIAKEKTNAEAALSSSVIETADLSFWKNIRGILKVPMVWVCCIANMAFLGSIYAGGTYGQLVLQTDPGWLIDKRISGYVPAFCNFASMIAYVAIPWIIAKVGNRHYVKFAVVGGVIAPLCFTVGYRSYDLPLICAMMVIAGITYGAIVPAPKVLMLQLPEVSGPRAGTALGLYVTVERIGITLATGMLGSILLPGQKGISVTMANFYILQLLSPILILIGVIMAQRKLASKKAIIV